MASTPPDHSSPFTDELVALRKLADDIQAGGLGDEWTTSQALSLFQNETILAWAEESWPEEDIGSTSLKAVLVRLEHCLAGGLELGYEFRTVLSPILLAFADWVEVKASITR